MRWRNDERSYKETIMNQETYKARREKMCAFLRTLKPEQFNIYFFKRETECGSVCCIAGWCPSVFPDRFKFVYIDDNPDYRYTIVWDLQNKEDFKASFWGRSLNQVASFFGFKLSEIDAEGNGEENLSPLDPEYYYEVHNYVPKPDSCNVINVDIETACKAIMECEYVDA